jgi:hypothetical protein
MISVPGVVSEIGALAGGEEMEGKLWVGLDMLWTRDMSHTTPLPMAERGNSSCSTHESHTSTSDTASE